MTKRMLHKEWEMPLDEAIESEAQAQALCMLTRDFARGYQAFVERRSPTFEGD
jgi:enoyl-CoA hydratase/carnithine racemase